MLYTILHVLDLDALVFAVTSPVLSCCIVAFPCVALTLAEGGQGEESSFLARNVTMTSSLLTATSITAPASVVTKVKFLSIFTTSAKAQPTSALIAAPYFLIITPISTECMIDTECHHRKVENNATLHVT